MTRNQRDDVVTKAGVGRHEIVKSDDQTGAARAGCDEDEAMPDATGPEKRGSSRQRVFKGGQIVFNDGASTINCTIRNYSEAGARLDVQSIIGVPEKFTLVTNDGTEKPCRVAWRSSTTLGVSFET